MTDTPKPGAQDMLRLFKTDEKGQAEFWERARSDAARILIREPWAHDVLVCDAHESYMAGPCTRCGQEANGSCPVPPPLLTDPPEVIAMRLTKRVAAECGADAIGIVPVILGCPTTMMNTLLVDWWKAEPQEIIAFCLVAMGEWTTAKETNSNR